MNRSKWLLAVAVGALVLVGCGGVEEVPSEEGLPEYRTTDNALSSCASGYHFHRVDWSAAGVYYGCNNQVGTAFNGLTVCMQNTGGYSCNGYWYVPIYHDAGWGYIRIQALTGH